MRKFGILITGLFMLSGCVSTLEGLGISPATSTQIGTVATNVLNDGTLVCKYGGLFAAVVGVKVTNAEANAVATACSAISVAGEVVNGAVPAPAPSASVMSSIPVATVPAPVAAAVAASVPSGA